MKKQLVRFSIYQTSLVIAVLYLILSAIVAVPLVIGWLFMGDLVGLAFLFMPFIYAIVAFLITALTLWLYNCAAGWVGGIEFHLSNDEKKEE